MTEDWRIFLKGLAGSALIFVSPAFLCFCSWAWSGFSGSIFDSTHGLYIFYLIWSVPAATIFLAIILVRLAARFFIRRKTRKA